MTIPTVIAEHKSKVLQSQFKKTYSELSQINMKFIYDYGMNMCEYEWTQVENGMGVGDASRTLADKFGEYFIAKNQNTGGWYKVLTNVVTLSGNAVDLTMFDDGYNYDFMKRTYFFEYGSPPNKCPIITVDINGSNKKPNTLGKDIFSFRPTYDGKVIPLGNPDTADDGKNGSGSFTECSKSGNSDLNGFGCAYWASIDKSPDDNTKSYWKDFIK